MAKKNKKNKGGNNNSFTPSKAVTDLSAEQIEKIEKFSVEENEAGVNEVAAEDLLETNEDASKIEDIKRTGNVDGYIDMLHSKLVRIKAIERKAEDIKTESLLAQEELKNQRKEFEEEKKNTEKELSELRKDLNQRDKKIQEDRLAIDNGEYSTVIQSLLDSLRLTEEEITGSTKRLIEEISKKHTSYISSLSELNKKQNEIEDQLLQLESVKAEMARERKRIEMSKASYEKRIKQDVEDEYFDRIQDLEDENSSLKRKNALLDKEVKSMSDFKRELMSSFESKDIDNMLKEQNALREKCKALETSIENCHSEAEYEEKVQAVETLKAKVQELENKVSEERLSELRLSLHNADAYVLEINTYKAQIDSAKAREKSLLRTVTDLHETINRLKDEEKAKEGAFEHARSMDEDAELQGQKQRRSLPKDLAELVDYLQYNMATREKEEDCFFYDKKTIRTFIAGLNMSPLSLLQGISGTGKTSLPREVATAFVSGDSNYTGQDKAGNRIEPYRICAVQSGWRDNMDLLGFYNNFEKKYKETDFFKALYLAAQPKYKNTLFFVILDEMNLSHPEHYFADFLSMMEQKENDRYVQIHADKDILPKILKEGQGQMLLPRNIRFIGTANHDETTLDFAPKTYDRANVMVMKTNEKKSVLEEIRNTIKGYQIPTRLSITYDWLSDKFKEADDDYLSKYNEFERFIKNEKLIKLLEDRGIGIGNRFNKQARKFICAYLALSDDSIKHLAEAVDHLITSRLLRSLRNRYDLTEGNLQEFQKDYEGLFAAAFAKETPKEGLKLLAEEIKKK